MLLSVTATGPVVAELGRALVLLGYTGHSAGEHDIQLLNSTILNVLLLLLYFQVRKMQMLDQRHGTNHIIDRKDSFATFKLAPPPIFVSTINNFN